MIQHLVTEEENGRKIMGLLRGPMQISYSAVKAAKWEHRILVNGSPRNVDETVSAGDLISFIQPDNHPEYTVLPWDFSLDVPYEDEALMIINKPAPLPSTSGQHQGTMTLENAVFSYLHQPRDFLYRPINRLDKGTSGLMAVAKDGHIQQLMQKQLHTESFRREYLAVIEGRLPEAEGTIRLPIRKESDTGVRRIIAPDGKPSVTHYQVLESKKGRSLVQLRLETGRTHQIRVHMAALGCPVCGDYIYGQELPELPGRFALHSFRLTLTHPLTGSVIALEAPLPRELSALLAD